MSRWTNVVVAAAIAACGTAQAAEDGVPGRVTAIAPVIWACPLDDWAAGRDDRCDPIDTGSAVVIFDRNVKPEGRHGPFALIEYTVGGRTKRQYVKDINVTPNGEDTPPMESLLRREAERTPREAGDADRPCAALSGDRGEVALLAFIDARLGNSELHREMRSTYSAEQFLEKFFANTLDNVRAACARGDEFAAGFAVGGDIGLYFGMVHSVQQ